MKGFNITIDIHATRIDNSFDMKVTREIDVDNDRNLDEIMDIPIGKLILGSTYAPHVSDITDVSKYSSLSSTNKLQPEIVPDGMSDEQKKTICDVLSNLSKITNPKSELENAKEQVTSTELTTKDSIEDAIYSNLNDFQKRVYVSIYVSIFCALVESKKFLHKAFEFEKYFTHYVSTDRDSEGYHVFFRYDRIHNGLPGFEIVFYDKSTVYLRYVDYISSQTWKHPLAMLKTDGDMKIYLSSLKFSRHYDPSILASVAAKLVHVEVLK